MIWIPIYLFLGLLIAALGAVVFALWIDPQCEEYDDEEL